MLRNYLVILLRTLRKHKGYALINILGLAVGLACGLLIVLYVQYEHSYDRFHEDADRIQRVNVRLDLPNETWSIATAAGPLGPLLADAFPEVEAQTRLVLDRLPLGRSEDGTTRDHEEVFYADSTVFDVFTFPLVQGDPATALQEPFQVVLTEQLADKYFGDADPIGRTLQVGQEHMLTVTGVMADVPDNTHLKVQALISMSTYPALQARADIESWGNFEFYTYLRLHRADQVAAVQAGLPDFVQRHLASTWGERASSYQLHLQAVPDIYLNSDPNTLGELGPRSNARTLYALSLVALFVLVIAGMNFMNLATARSLDRAKEVGVRKTVGAGRRMLVAQFMVEAVGLSLVATSLAYGLTWMAFPAFAEVAGKALDAGMLASPWIVAVLLVTGVSVGLLAGAYPAFVLSGFHPASVLKGRFESGRQGVRLRKGLVVFQFALSVALIAGTFIVQHQLDYVRTRDVGYEAGRTVVLNFGDGPTAATERPDVLACAFESVPGVSSVTFSSNVPGANSFSSTDIALRAADGAEQEIGMRYWSVGADFADQYGLQLLAGRFLSAQPTEMAAMVVNAATVEALGYATPDDIIGQPYTIDDGVEGTVIGVVEDFNYQSLHFAIQPLALMHTPSRFRHASLHIEADALQPVLADLEAVWTRMAPALPFAYEPLDDVAWEQYEAEQQFSRVLALFTVLAIFVACLGLFGLAAYTTARRTREIGIRKALGASVASIVHLLAREYVVLVLVAVVVASPLMAWVMQRWLADFAYRIEVSPLTFVWAGGLALTIALLTVSVQSIRAATIDPVKALERE